MSIAYLDPGNIESDLQSGSVAQYRYLFLYRYKVSASHRLGLSVPVQVPIFFYSTRHRHRQTIIKGIGLVQSLFSVGKIVLATSNLFACPPMSSIY
jgi:hypothetical protein